MFWEVKSKRIPDLKKSSFINRNTEVKGPIHFNELNWMFMKRNLIDYMGIFFFFLS